MDAVIPLKDSLHLKLIRGAILLVVWLEWNRVCFNDTRSISDKALGAKILSLTSFWCQSSSDNFFLKLSLILPSGVMVYQIRSWQRKRKLCHSSCPWQPWRKRASMLLLPHMSLLGRWHYRFNVWKCSEQWRRCGLERFRQLVFMSVFSYTVSLLLCHLNVAFVISDFCVVGFYSFKVCKNRCKNICACF